MTQLNLLEPVFQRRRFLGRLSSEGLPMDRAPLGQVDGKEERSEVVGSEYHVRTLCEALISSPSQQLEPLRIWWSGHRWYVIDGHHRLFAYRRASKQGKLKKPIVAVRAFRGDVCAAIAESARTNARDKLPMSKSDKLEAAWVLVKLGGASRAEISGAAGVASRTVANMRAKLADLRGDPECENDDLTWEEVLAGARVLKDYDEAWEERQALEWSRRLAKTFGSKFGELPKVAAMALERYRSSLATDLVEHWVEIANRIQSKHEDWESDF